MDSKIILKKCKNCGCGIHSKYETCYECYEKLYKKIIPCIECDDNLISVYEKEKFKRCFDCNDKRKTGDCIKCNKSILPDYKVCWDCKQKKAIQ